MRLLYYLLEVNGLLALHLLLYAALLRRQNRLQLNRVAMLGGVALAWILPLLPFGLFWSYMAAGLGGSGALPALRLAPIRVTAYVSSSGSLDSLSIIGLIYLSGVLVSSGILAGRLIRIYRTLKSLPYTRMPGYRLYRLPAGRAEAFSFMNAVMVTAQVPEAILAHELVHVRQRHSVDVLVLEVVRVLCWCNPAVYVLVRLLRELHEYLADRDSSAILGSAAYAELLVSVAMAGRYEPLLQAFHARKCLQNRLRMLYRIKQGRSPIRRYLLSLPLMAAGFLVAGSIFAASPGFKTPKPEIGLHEGMPAGSLPGQPDRKWPSFPGGNKALFAFLSQHIHFPKEARALGHQGTVIVQFRVQASGELSDIRAVGGSNKDKSLREEGVRVVRLMPKWVPAEKKGHPVASDMTLPIQFVL